MRGKLGESERSGRRKKNYLARPLRDKARKTKGFSSPNKTITKVMGEGRLKRTLIFFYVLTVQDFFW